MLSLRELPRVEALEADARRISSLDPAAVLAFLSVVVTSVEIERRIDVHFGRYGLSHGRFLVLMLLRRREDHTATPAEIAEEAQVTRATVTGLVDGLEAEGLVERAHRSDDRRSVHVRLTRKGDALLDRMLPDHYARIGAVMARLTRAEKKQLTGLLGKVREGLLEMLAGEGPGAR
jgi:DNA-binding MarR family transcriptional regulator